MAYQAVYPQSALNNYLNNQDTGQSVAKPLLLGGLLGTLILLKANFLFFLLFLGLYLLWRLFTGRLP